MADDRERRVSAAAVATVQPTVAIDDGGAGLAVLLDAAITQIVELETRGYRPDQISVPRAAYAQIATAHARDVSRGIPLIVLGLSLLEPRP
jgi:hypothetical protein